MTLSSGNPDSFDPVGSVLRTQVDVLESVVTHWHFQILNNVDCIAEDFKELLKPDDYIRLLNLLETTVKRPIRRQGGRLRGVAGSLKALLLKPSS
jgi:hypothetical protein